MERSPDPVNQAFKVKLGNLFKARFPFVYLRTCEEDRAEALIRMVVRDPTLIKTRRRVYVWNVFNGLTGEGMHERTELKDPLKMLEWIEQLDEPAVFILKDFHHFCAGNGQNDAQILRRLKDLAGGLQYGDTPRNIVFLSGQMQLPDVLERETHVIDLHLPTAAEICALLYEMMSVNGETGRIAFNLAPEDEERLVKAALGLTLKEAENAFAYAMVHDGQLSVADVNIILEEKCQALRKTDILEFIRTEVEMTDVGGLENLKGWLSKRKNAWLDAAGKYGLPAPKGILLTGIPGCGKSMVAKAVGHAWELPLIRLDPGRIYSGLMGGSEENIRKAIRVTEAIAPCVLWIDEIEKGFGVNSGNGGDSGTSMRVFGSFLTWLQEKTQPVFVVATANNIDALPPELLRKGRFDEIFFVGLPGQAERVSILYLHLKKRLKSPDVIGDLKLSHETLNDLAHRMDGFNGAEIEQVVIAALFEAFAENRALRLSDLERIIRSTVPLVVTQAESIARLRAWAKDRTVSASGAAPVPDVPLVNRGPSSNGSAVLESETLPLPGIPATGPAGGELPPTTAAKQG